MNINEGFSDLRGEVDMDLHFDPPSLPPTSSYDHESFQQQPNQFTPNPSYANQFPAQPYTQMHLLKQQLQYQQPAQQPYTQPQNNQLYQKPYPQQYPQQLPAYSNLQQACPPMSCANGQTLPSSFPSNNIPVSSQQPMTLPLTQPSFIPNTQSSMTPTGNQDQQVAYPQQLNGSQPMAPSQPVVPQQTPNAPPVSQTTVQSLPVETKSSQVTTQPQQQLQQGLPSSTQPPPSLTKPPRKRPLSPLKVTLPFNDPAKATMHLIRPGYRHVSPPLTEEVLAIREQVRQGMEKHFRAILKEQEEDRLEYLRTGSWDHAFSLKQFFNPQPSPPPVVEEKKEDAQLPVVQPAQPFQPPQPMPTAQPSQNSPVQKANITPSPSIEPVSRDEMKGHSVLKGTEAVEPTSVLFSKERTKMLMEALSRSNEEANRISGRPAEEITMAALHKAATIMQKLEMDSLKEKAAGSTTVSASNPRKRLLPPPPGGTVVSHRAEFDPTLGNINLKNTPIREFNGAQSMFSYNANPPQNVMAVPKQ